MHKINVLVNSIYFKLPFQLQPQAQVLKKKKNCLRNIYFLLGSLVCFNSQAVWSIHFYSDAQEAGEKDLKDPLGKGQVSWVGTKGRMNMVAAVTLKSNSCRQLNEGFVQNGIASVQWAEVSGEWLFMHDDWWERGHETFSNHH